jgi:hypothetical protein
MFHVIPTARRADHGVDEPYAAILSTELDFASAGGMRSAYEALEALMGDLAHATGKSVEFGTISVNGLESTKVVRLAGRRSARSELVRILACAGGALSWRLLYEPVDPGKYCLNIRGVAPVNR